MSGITEAEAKFAPVSLLDALGDGGDTHGVQNTTAEQCADCLLKNPFEGHEGHCVGEVTDFDA